MTRTATHAGRAAARSSATRCRGDGDGLVDEVGRQVVVDQHVAARDHDAAQAPQQRLRAVGLGRSADEHGLRLEQHGAEDLQPGLAQRRAGRDDVGDGIGDAELHGGLHRAVERHEVDRDALLVEEAVDEARVGRRDAQALEVADVRKRPGGPAKRNVEPPKPSCSISRAPGIRASSSRSRPVMPTSSAPEPT
jgi:hypothetical protein